MTVILILVSQRAEVQVILMFGTDAMKTALEESMKKQRGNGPSTLEAIVVIYVLGFIWEETREIYSEGIRSYLRNLWNFIDFTRNSIYCFTFLLRAIAYIQQMSQINMDPATAYIPREKWDDFDPQLIVNILLKHHLKQLAIIMIDFLFLLIALDGCAVGGRSLCSSKHFLSSQARSFVLN